MKRFRTHAVVLALIAVGVLVMIFSHAVRLRLEWGTGGFILGLIAASIVGLDLRHHRRHELR